MTDKETNDEIAERARRAIAARQASYDAATLSRLNQARQQAVSHLGKPQRSRAIWTPALGAVASAVVAVGLYLREPAPVASDWSAELAGADDMELLLAGEDIEMLEDLEFFELMDVLAQAPGDGGDIG